MTDDHGRFTCPACRRRDSERVGIKESELEDAVVKNAKAVFGEKTLYFPIKQKVESATKQRATDGILLDLSTPASPSFWLVEVELSTHDMMNTVGPQIKNFLSALKNEDTLRRVLDTLYKQIQSDRSKYNMVRNLVGAREEVHYFLDRLLHNEEARGVVIVIDEYVDELEELISDWFTGQKVKTVFFKIYEKGAKKIFYYTPYAAEVTEVLSPEVRRKYPETYLSWKAAYDKAPDNIKRLADTLTQRVEEAFPDVEHGPAMTRSWYKFLIKGIKGRRKAHLLVFWLTRSHLHLRIGINPRKFDDPKQIAKVYKRFFWARLPNVQERRFNVESENELDYALTLVKQSYERSRTS